MSLVLAALLLQESDTLRKHVETLSADDMEGRGTGTPGADRAADYVFEALRKLGLEPKFQEFDLPVRNDKSVRAKNVLAILPGTDETLRAEYVVVGAHYDGLGKRGDENPGRMPGDRNDAIWNGADDNASGVAALLEIARVLAKAPPKRSVIFAAFAAEEFLSAGSLRFARDPAPVKFEAIAAMVNLHMLGRNPDRKLDVFAADSSDAWPELLRAAARDLVEIRLADESPQSGDQASFAHQRVPAVMIFGGFHEDYHGAADHASKISWDALAKRATFSLRLVEAAANLPKRMTWRPPRTAGALGIQGLDLPDEEAERLGLAPDEGGVRVADVAPGSPAEKAGLRLDDYLVGFAGKKLSRNGAKAELQTAIQGLRSGDSVEIDVIRNRERVKLKVVWP